MALRNLATRMRGPAAAYALRRHPGPGVPPPALSRFLGTTRGQNDITIHDIIWMNPFDMERYRDDVKRYKIEDKIMRENLSWDSRYYKTMEWTCYVVLSVSTAILIACEVDVRSRKKDKGHLQAGLICEL